MLGEKPVVYFLYAPSKILLQVCLVYFNLYFLIPKFFNPKKLRWRYWLLILSLLAVSGLINFIIELVVWREFNVQDPPNFLRMYLLNCQMPLRYLVFSALLKKSVDFYQGQEHLKKVELEKVRAQMDLLKAQVNPHFIFNTLNNLYALSIEKSDKTSESILMLSDILKYMLTYGNEEKVLLKKEVQLLINYVELERLRKTNADIKFETDPVWDLQMITPLLLIPFVENAFKYGLNTVAKNGFVYISVHVKNNLMEMMVENNMPPPNNMSALDSLGIGLANVKKRLALFYLNKYELYIEKKEKSFFVKLTLKLI